MHFVNSSPDNQNLLSTEKPVPKFRTFTEYSENKIQKTSYERIFKVLYNFLFMTSYKFFHGIDIEALHDKTN